MKLKIKVIGLGGVGGCLMDTLPRYLNFLDDTDVELTLVDGDSYEEHNRPRQSFSQLGNKAEVTADNIKKEFSRILCWTIADYVSDINVSMVVKEGDIVFCCVDNHATRKLLSDRCEELKNVVLISGGNEYTDGNIQVHVRKKGKNLTLPVANKYHPEIQNPKDKNPADEVRKAGCDAQRKSEPQLLIANNNVATLMLNTFYGVQQQGAFDRYDEVYFDVLLNRSLPRKRKGED